MNLLRIILYPFYVFTLVASLLLGMSACQPGSSSGDKATSTDAKQPALAVDSTQKETTDGPVMVSLTQAQYDMAAIKLGQPTPRPLSTTLKVNGMIDVPAQNMVSVSVPFGGYIRQIQLEPGMRIRKGQTLVVLENPEYIQLQQDYLDTKAKLDYADLEFVRQQELSRDNVNALKIFQQTRSSRQSLQAQLAGAAQRLAILRINPTTLNADRLTRTITVPSPVSGFVTDVPVNNGRFVNPADVLVQITNTDHLHVRLNVFEKDINRIHTGQVVRFGMGGDGALAHRATIFLLGKSIAADRTIPVLGSPRRQCGCLHSGRVCIGAGERENPALPALPESAVVGYGDKHYVYVLDRKGGKSSDYSFRQVEVKTGVRENGYVAVTLPNDLNPEKTPIVVSGGYNLLAKLNNSEEE